MTVFITIGFILLELCLVFGLATHILLRKSGSTEARLTWILLVVLLPYAGAVAYLLLSAPRSYRHTKRHSDVRGSMPSCLRTRAIDLPNLEPDLPGQFQPVFTLAESISDTDVMAGHSLELVGSTEEFFDRLVEDIHAATSTVHLLTYIYLDDESGQRVGSAMIEAAGRGVACRLMVDGLGSNEFLRSKLHAELVQAGVNVVESLPTRLWKVLWSRMDVRNHRKIVVIDNRIGWIGSQNIASKSFCHKPRFAPWIDCMVRILGPAVHDLQELFIEDWCLDTGEQLAELLDRPPTVLPDGATIQIIGSGPNFRNEVLPMIFQASIGAATDELIITTPYFVPDVATSAAIRSAALRGVRTKIVVPARNDSRLVSLASRGQYERLLSAGVEIHEFTGGLLHAKTMTVDRELFLVGSANLDRRSLELNFEVSMIGWDSEFASRLRFLQVEYMEQSTGVNPAAWMKQSAPRRLMNNAAGLLSPLL